MAANILELLKQIQRDIVEQKKYMKNLHAANRNFENINLKISELDNKIDKQRVTIEKIEKHVKKNNMVLFGEETQINLTDTENNKTNIQNKEKKAHLLEKTEKYIENTEVDEMERGEKGTESNRHVYGDGNRKNDSFEKADTDKRIKEFIDKNKMNRETKESIKQIAATKTSIEEAFIPANVIIDNINNLNDELKHISDIYQSDMKDLKCLIKEFMATAKMSNEKPARVNQESAAHPIDTATVKIIKLNDKLKVISDMFETETKEIKELIKNIAETLKVEEKSTDSKQNTSNISIIRNNMSSEQISKLGVELKQINEIYQSEIQSKKQLIDDLVVTMHKINEVAANRARKQVTVTITPTYLNTEQITKLNEELKRITEMYLSTDVFPIIKVQSGPCDHPVMKQLSKGVYYKGILSNTKRAILKLGPNDLKRSEVLELVTEYPDLSLNEVVKAIAISRNTWAEWSKQYNFNVAYHQTAEGLKPLDV